MMPTLYRRGPLRRRVRAREPAPVVATPLGELWRLTRSGGGALWRTPPGDATLEAKVEAMRQVPPPPGFAWPKVSLFDASGGFAGYTLRQPLSKPVPLGQILASTAANRRQALAAEIAGLVADLHALGYRRLPLRHGLVVDAATLRPVLLAPERADLRLDRAPPADEADDLDALARVLFAVLTGGLDPMSGAFAYGFPPAPDAGPAGLALPVAVREMFERALTTLDERPSAAAWAGVLGRATAATAKPPAARPLRTAAALGCLLLPSCTAPLFDSLVEPGLVRGTAVLGAREVRGLQADLTRLGFTPGPVDGIWGSRAAAALERFAHAGGFLLQPSPAGAAPIAAAADRGLTLARGGFGGRIRPAWQTGGGVKLDLLDLAALGRAAVAASALPPPARTAWSGPLRPSRGWVVRQDDGPCPTYALTMWHAGLSEPIVGRAAVCLEKGAGPSA